MNFELEYRILSSFKKGKVVEEGERDAVYDLSALGLLNIGLTTETNPPRETAALTPKGKRELKNQEDYRHPIKRFFYNFIDGFC